MEIPIENCEICNDKLTLENNQLNISECSKCHKLACDKCIDYRPDVKKWLCKDCYSKIINPPKPIAEKKFKTMLSFMGNK